MQLQQSYGGNQSFTKDCVISANGNKPEAFSSSCLKPIPKKEDIGYADNYRGITLTTIASKINNSLLLDRIAKYIDLILRYN